MKKRFTAIALFVLVGIISLLPLSDLLRQGLPVTHDGQDHVARIANFYASLTEGNAFPRWASGLNWGYGHPILMFLYPLPSYTASLFHALGFSFVDSTKLVFAAAFVLSALSMYLWVAAAWGKSAGFAAAMLYAFAPYRFVDLYVRGAIGEHVAFIFLPLICYGLFLLARDAGRTPSVPVLWITLGTAGLILSHNALSIMFLPLISAYALYLSAHDTAYRSRFLLLAGMSVGFGFLLTSFFWVPAYIEGKYTLRDIVTKGDITNRFVPWTAFLYSPWSYGGGNDLSKWLGAGQILAVIMSVFVLDTENKRRHLIIGSLLILLFTLFMMTVSSSPIWNTVTLLQKFQFPWRLLSVSTAVLAVLGGLAVAESAPGKRKFAAALLIAVSIAATCFMWRAKEYRVYPETFFTGTYNGTTDTGESSPIWSVRFMENRPAMPALLFPGENGEITAGRRTTTQRTYHVRVTTPSRFVENTLYFPGWNVLVNGSALPVDTLIFQDPQYRGLMTLNLKPGDYDLSFIFSETRLRRISDTVSVVSGIVFILVTGTIHLLWRTKKFI